MKKIISTLLLATMVIALVPSFSGAAALTKMSLALSTNTQGVETNATITFTTSTGVAAGETIVLEVPDGFNATGALDHTDIDVTVDSVELDLDATADGTTWGAVFSNGPIITITSDTDTIDAASVVVIEIGTNATEGVTGNVQIVNPSTPDSYGFALTAGTDTGTFAVAIVDDSNLEVTGEVVPFLEMDISSSTIDFGTVDADTNGTDTHTVIIDTNSVGGYVLQYYATPLTNTANSSVIDNCGVTLFSGTPEGFECWGFNLAVNSNLGIGAVPTGTGASPQVYDSEYTSDNHYKIQTEEVVDLAKGNTPSDTHTYTASFVASISSITESGDYTGTVEYFVTGNF